MQHMLHVAHMCARQRAIECGMPMQGSAMTRICDLGLGIVLPFHSHVSLNAVVSDYVPYAWRSALQPMPMAAVMKLLAFHRPAAFQMYRRKLVLGRECSRVDALLSHSYNMPHQGLGRSWQMDVNVSHARH